MPTAEFISSGHDGRRPTRLAVWLGAAFICVVALMPALTVEWRQATMAYLAAAAVQSYASGGMSGFVLALANAAGWAALLCSPVLAITASWFAVESMLVGLPKRLRWVGFIVAVETGMVLVYFFTAPLLQKIMPIGLFQPLLLLRSDIIPGPFQYLFDVVLASLALIVRGFFGYWAHRASHAIPALWHFHSIHHSIENVDAVTDVVHPVDVLVGRLGLMIMALILGFQHDTFVVLAGLFVVFSELQHTRAPISLGPLGKVLVDRNFHLTHHSLDPKYYDTNYSTTLIFYDKIFGTYVEPDGKPILTGLRHVKPPSSVWEFITARLQKREPEATAPSP